MHDKGLWRSLASLVGHLVKLHVRIAIGAPAYAEMKDGVSTVMTFMTLALATSLPLVFIGSGNSELMDWKTQAYWLSLAVTPMLFISFAVTNLTPTIYMFPAVLYGACTVVNVVSFGLWLTGVVDVPLSMTTVACQVALWALSYFSYRRQRAEVRTKGYGLRHGEF